VERRLHDLDGDSLLRYCGLVGADMGQLHNVFVGLTEHSCQDVRARWLKCGVRPRKPSPPSPLQVRGRGLGGESCTFVEHAMRLGHAELRELVLASCHDHLKHLRDTPLGRLAVSVPHKVAAPLSESHQRVAAAIRDAQRSHQL
jgi:hypothetical protein